MQQQPCRATGLGLAYKPISKFFVVNGNAPSRFSEAIKPQEAAIFREVVASCDPTHFRKSDVPILATLCTATYLSRFYADLRRCGLSEQLQTIQPNLQQKGRRPKPTERAIQLNRTPGEAEW